MASGARGNSILKDQAGEAGPKTLRISPDLKINVLLSSVVYPFFVDLVYKML